MIVQARIHYFNYLTMSRKSLMCGNCSSLNRKADFKGTRHFQKELDTLQSGLCVFYIQLVFHFESLEHFAKCICTITRGQVSLSESIQYEKEKFPQREGNCLKVNGHHFVSASCSEGWVQRPTALCAALCCSDEQKA